MADASTAGQQGGALVVEGVQQQGKPVINSWVAWFLFGLGWISIFFLGMSLIPFGLTAKKVLAGVAVPFLLCWWAGAILGAGSNLTGSRKHAWRSNLIMALTGTGLAGLYLAVYLYYHSPAVSTVVTAVAIYAALHYYSKAQTLGAPAAAGAGAAPGEGASQQ